VRDVGEAKTKVTLIGSEIAKAGLEFIYEGAIPECGACSLRKACNNLKAGKRYRVVGVRKATHDCPVHFNGASAVEVVDAAVPALIHADMAIKNTRISFECTCSQTGCEGYLLCHPDGAVEGEKYTVAAVKGNAPNTCEKGKALKLVDLMAV
jgi:uncharacterized protein